MPIQHGSDAVLARMRRPERQRTIRERVATHSRTVVPDVAIRTTCIVGFPGETEDDFETLLAFLEEIQFDRVGAFTYSPQEGTRAAEMDDDVPDAVKRERLERLNELQRLITAERYERALGRTVRAIVDRVDDDGVAGAHVWQADDIDGVTYARRRATASRRASFVDVRARRSRRRLRLRGDARARRLGAAGDRAPRDARAARARLDRQLRSVSDAARTKSWSGRASCFPAA